MGDFNLNLLNSDSHSATGEFLDNMISLMLLPIISRPTRVTSSSATLIDNIFTNVPLQSLRCGVFFTDISDHFPIFAISNFTLANKVKFNDTLMQTNWDVVYNSCDPNEAYDAFVSTFVQIFNRCFPFKQANRKLLTSIEKPWISYALLKSINTKKQTYLAPSEPIFKKL